MKQTTTPDYGRTFKRMALRHLPHHSLLVLARKHNSPRIAAYLDRSIRSKLDYSPTLRHAPDLIQKYIEVTNKTKLWHGTGRLQYNGSDVVDTLAAIIHENTLTPARDVYSIVLAGEEMESLSTTTLRIIARSYADTHGKGMQEQHRYGSSLWWVAYYYGLCYAEILVKYSPLMIKNWAAFRRASTNAQGERTWGKKVHSEAKGVWDTFGLGSDIAGNYPVLFGIKDVPDIAPLPKSIQKWEVRIIKPITLSDITHIEVPEQKVSEVRKLLLKHKRNVPVFPLELGEYLASQQSLADLLHPK